MRGLKSSAADIGRNQDGCDSITSSSGFRKYVLVILLIVCASITLSTLTPRSDFAQDYLAARAAGDGRSPNTLTRDLANTYGVPEAAITSRQNAHPPLVILLAAPFARLPWNAAHLSWEILLCSVVGALLLMLRAPVLDTLLLAPAWIFGLSLGNIDGIVVCLCLLAVSVPYGIRTGVALGLAAALKVYPLMLVMGLLATGCFTSFVIAVFTGAGLTLIATSYLGVDSLTGWIRYIPQNGDFFSNNIFNMSSTKIASTFFGISNLKVLALGIVMVCLQYRKKGLEPLLAGMLLVAPLAWLQQLAFLTNKLKTTELFFCFACSMVIVVNIESVASFASFCLTLLILFVYLRLALKQYRDEGAQNPERASLGNLPL